MHAACLEAEIPGSVSKFESVQGATIACVTPRTRSDSVRFAHLHAQRLMTLCINGTYGVQFGKLRTRQFAGTKGRKEAQKIKAATLRGELAELTETVK